MQLNMTNNDWISVDKHLPDKGIDVLVKISDDVTYTVFRCNCHNPDCREWRDSLTGYGLIINPKYWRPIKS